MMQHVDGIYAEMADLNGSGYAHGVGSALAALEKPVILWNHAKKTLLPEQLEVSLQGHLLLGVYPTVWLHCDRHCTECPNR